MIFFFLIFKNQLRQRLCMWVCVSHSVGLTLCNPMSYSPPGFSVHGVLQARILEWVCLSFLQGIFLTQSSKLVPCSAGRFFTIWATREAQGKAIRSHKKRCHCFHCNQIDIEGHKNSFHWNKIWQFLCIKSGLSQTGWHWMFFLMSWTHLKDMHLNTKTKTKSDSLRVLITEEKRLGDFLSTRTLQKTETQ